MKKLRLFVSVLLLAGLVAGSLLVPVPHYVRCPFAVQVRDAATVYVDVAGSLSAICVQPGEVVEAGQVLAVLQNAEIDMALVDLTGQRERLVARLEALQLQAYNREAALLELAEVRTTIASLDQRIARRRLDRERLTLRAPRAGTVIPAAALESHDPEETLPTWTGHPLQPENMTALLQPGVTLCQIGTPTQLEAVLAVDESQLTAVRQGQQVELFPDQLRGERVTGTIAQIALTDVHMNAASFARDTNTVVKEDHALNRSSRRLSSKYQANVPLEHAGFNTESSVVTGTSTLRSTILSGGHGWAKLHAGSQPLGHHLWQYLCRTFHFEL